MLLLFSSTGLSRAISTLLVFLLIIAMATRTAWISRDVTYYCSNSTMDISNKRHTHIHLRKEEKTKMCARVYVYISLSFGVSFFFSPFFCFFDCVYHHDHHQQQPHHVCLLFLFLSCTNRWTIKNAQQPDSLRRTSRSRSTVRFDRETLVLDCCEDGALDADPSLE